MQKLSILSEILTYISDYNKNAHTNFEIDAIRVTFSKQYKLLRLKELGTWRKIKPHSLIARKLKKRINQTQFTSCRQLEGYNIVYYNIQEPQYIKAQMVCFGLSQYEVDMSKKTVNLNAIDAIITILKDVSSVDICIDFTQTPNIEALRRHFFIDEVIGSNGQTFYVNNPRIMAIDKFYVYDKAAKNGLRGVLWRLEAQIPITNPNALFLPLDGLQSIFEILTER